MKFHRNIKNGLRLVDLQFVELSMSKVHCEVPHNFEECYVNIKVGWRVRDLNFVKKKNTHKYNHLCIRKGSTVLWSSSLSAS